MAVLANDLQHKNDAVPAALGIDRSAPFFVWCGCGGQMAVGYRASATELLRKRERG